MSAGEVRLYHLCYAAAEPLGPACDRMADHGGPHTWEVINDEGEPLGYLAGWNACAAHVRARLGIEDR